MYEMKLEWKIFNINLSKVETWLKVNAGEYYLGNSADYQLTLWFSEDPGEEVRSAIQAYWNTITEESEEVTSYVSIQTILNACAQLRTTLHTKLWDEMSVAERKLVLGQMPTREELGL